MNHQDLSGAASGSGYGGGYCPEGIPVELGLLTILAAFGVAFGVLYLALTLTTGKRKKRNVDKSLSCEAESVEDLIGCRVGQISAGNPRLGKIVDLIWHGESIFCYFCILRLCFVKSSFQNAFQSHRSHTVPIFMLLSQMPH